ncbi:periplasmic binding protein-like I [Zopfochytrium polystomum]|nr:periplasmic binding protein-like I [Zopfochytrium polystomum]
MPLATSTLLSDRISFPTGYRVMTSGPGQSSAILRLISSKNFSRVAVFSINDDFGTGMLSSLESAASSYNISFGLLATGDRSSQPNWDAYFDQVQARRLQVIVLAISFNYVVPLFRSADRMGMLNGDYWFVSATSWDQNVFANDVDLLPKIVGVWQTEQPNAYDYNPTGSTPEAQDIYNWWRTLNNPNNASFLPGLPVGFTMLSIVNQIKPFPVGTVVVKNETYVQGVVGNQCFGKGMYPQSWFVVLTKALGYAMPIPYKQIITGYSCMKLTVAIFDYLLKSGVPLSKIQDRSAFAGLNFTDVINNAKVADLYGSIMHANKDADIDLDISIYIYQNTSLGIMASPVGNWSYATDTISFFEGRSIVFLGNKTAPPTPPTIPVRPFAAKMALRYAIDAVVCCCVVFSLATVVIMFMNMSLKVFKASSPIFLVLMVVGANISYAGVLYFSDDRACILHAWFKYLGFACAFGALLVKTFRISVIFADKSHQKRGVKTVKLSDGTLRAEAFRPRLVTDVIASVAPNGTVLAYDEMPHCLFIGFLNLSSHTSRNPMAPFRPGRSYICLAAMALTLAYGTFLTNSVKNLPSAFNESKWLAMAIYNWVVIGIVLNAIADFAVQDPDVIFVMDALMVIITQTGICGLLMVPKILACWRGEGDVTGMGVGTSGLHSVRSATNVEDAKSGGSHNVPHHHHHHKSDLDLHHHPHHHKSDLDAHHNLHHNKSDMAIKSPRVVASSDLIGVHHS